jgi:hypothetical protein
LSTPSEGRRFSKNVKWLSSTSSEIMFT